MRSLLILPLIALVAGSATAGNDPPGTRSAIALEKKLAGRVIGEPRRCLPARDADIMNVYQGTVLFRRNSKVIYRNDMDGCRILREDDILQTNLYGSAQLCDGDIVQIIDRAGGFGRGACVFGPFVPYRRPS
jgi:hypothetical protein